MKQQIVDLLEELNAIYNGELVANNINDYVDKILEKAKLIKVNKSGKLIGFIAFYNDDIVSKTAFLSMLAIKPLYQNEGYGKQLLDLSIKDIKEKGFKKYGLEVLKTNSRAITFYKNQGFMPLENRTKYLYMEKLL